MKVLLTGATGFVGSHILDALRAHGIPTAVLLRPTSNPRFIHSHLAQLEVRIGSITDPASLHPAVREVTHLIHCAGVTKALNSAGFFAGNPLGTRHLLQAVREHRGKLERLVHISSLAAVGPATAAQPAREDDPPHPVSAYGRSKLAGEAEIISACPVPFVIVRPPAVYGPRDDGFLGLFQAVKRHLLPRFIGGVTELSMVYAKDLAAAVVACLTHPAAVGRTYHLAAPAVQTPTGFAREIARQLNTPAREVPLPVGLLWPVCLVRQLLSWVTRRPHVLGLQKYPELRAPGWVCDPTRLRTELGFVAGTSMTAGIAETLAWYREAGWL